MTKVNILTELWDHQRDMSDFIITRYHLRSPAFLAADKGTGKTLSVLRAMFGPRSVYGTSSQAVGRARPRPESPSGEEASVRVRECEVPLCVLVVAPKLAVSVWRNEVERHLEGVAFHAISEWKGSVKDKTEKLIEVLKECEGNNIFAVHYDIVYREPLLSLLKNKKKVQFRYIVSDESHRIKTPGSKTSKAMFAIAKGQEGSFRICMTATPVPNGLQDFYAQARFLDVGLFGKSYNRFLSEYTVRTPVPGTIGVYKIIGYKNREKYDGIVNYCMKSMSIEDTGMSLPDKKHSSMYIDGEKSVMIEYRKMEKDSIAVFKDASMLAGNALERMLRLHQITGRGKKSSLNDFISDITPPLAVFYQYNSDLDIIREVCKQHKLSFGEINGNNNDIDKWANGSIDVIILQYRSGSESIDLTRTNNCLFYSLTWNAAAYDQALGRVYRATQKYPVTWYYLIARNTIDETIYESLLNKLSVSDTLLGRYRNESQEGKVPSVQGKARLGKARFVA